TERAFRGHGGEVTQMTELHGIVLQYGSIPSRYKNRHNRSCASSGSGPSFFQQRIALVPIAPTRIEDVETILVDLPTIRPHQLSMTTMKGQTLMILRIRTSDGIVGIGEGTTIGGLAYGPESPEGMKLAIDTYFAPILLQSDPNRIGRTMGAINKAIQGNNFAKCAVETALVDALGKRSRVTAAELLGGRVHDRLPVAWTLASGDTATDIAEA